MDLNMPSVVGDGYDLSFQVIQGVNFILANVREINYKSRKFNAYYYKPLEKMVSGVILKGDNILTSQMGGYENGKFFSLNQEPEIYGAIEELADNPDDEEIYYGVILLTLPDELKTLDDLMKK